MKKREDEITVRIAKNISVFRKNFGLTQMKPAAMLSVDPDTVRSWEACRDLRRTFATRLVNAGKPIFDVQHLLGHTNPETTMIYARVGMEQLRSTVCALS